MPIVILKKVSSKQLVGLCNGIGQIFQYRKYRNIRSSIITCHLPSTCPHWKKSLQRSCRNGFVFPAHKALPILDQYGADTMRLYEMFMGDFEQAAPWQTSAIAGCNRFLDRVWALSDKLVEGEGYRPAMETLMQQTIKKVSADIEGLKMNTAIAQLMTLVNALYDNGGANKAEFETLVQLLNPFAPHMTEELWEKLGHSHDEQLAYYPWPAYEEAKCVEAAVEIAVQVNGKVKARLKVPADITAEDAIAADKADPAVAAALEGKQLVKEIYVKGRLVNLAAKG